MKTVHVDDCKKCWNNMFSEIDYIQTLVDFQRARKKLLAKFNARFDPRTRYIIFDSEADYAWFVLTYS